jgi:catechol-2,3-dioxygenase
MVADFNNAGKTVKSPAYLAHVVLRSNKLPLMSEFYKKFLNATASYENDTISFLRYDKEHHRIAIVAIPGTKDKDPKCSGLEHIAFTYNTLDDLFISYRQRKALGMEPVWCINHGATTSLYYKDPDGNQLETQVDNFDTDEEATAFMRSDMFAQNPIGTEFDPEAMISRIESGEDEISLKKRVESGVIDMQAFVAAAEM